MAGHISRSGQTLSRKTVLLVSCTLCGVLLLLVVVIIYVCRRRKNKIQGHKGNLRVQPWLSSGSPVLISRPMHILDKCEAPSPPFHENLCPVPTFDDAKSVYENEDGPVNQSSRDVALPLPDLHSTYLQSRDTIRKIQAWALQASKHVRTPSFLPEVKNNAPETRQPPITSRISFPATVAHRNRTTRYTLRQTLGSKRSVSGRTILIQDDTKTRPASSYSEDYRISMYPSTPSDPGHTTFSRHATPAASRHPSWVAPRWQEEPFQGLRHQ